MRFRVYCNKVKYIKCYQLRLTGNYPHRVHFYTLFLNISLNNFPCKRFPETATGGVLLKSCS